MQFDSADLAWMLSNGLLLSVIEHEMGHVLGIGTIWSDKGLLSGAGGNNPIFTGSRATAAYNQVFGTSARGVPVENTGGSGTADSHWRETVFTTELMTGWAGPGTNLPLSVVTVASLADLGYSVNMAAADPFTPSSSGRSAASQAAGNGTSASIVAAVNSINLNATADDNTRGRGTSTEFVSGNSTRWSTNSAQAVRSNGAKEYTQTEMLWAKPQVVDSLFKKLAAGDRDVVGDDLTTAGDRSNGSETAALHFLALG
jgi:hypothetical protein